MLRLPEKNLQAWIPLGRSLRSAFFTRRFSRTFLLIE